MLEVLAGTVISRRLRWGISDRNLGSLAEAPGGDFEGGRRAGGVCLGDEA